MIEILVGLLKGILGEIVWEELAAGCAVLARWLVRRSAALLPHSRERYEEEWLAIIEERGTPLRRLVFALGIWRGCSQLCSELKKSPPAPSCNVREQVNKDNLDCPIEIKMVPGAGSQKKLEEILEFLRQNVPAGNVDDFLEGANRNIDVFPKGLQGNESAGEEPVIPSMDPGAKE